ncbi:hypothetical protein GCM10010102_20310 [Promicromonospora citrea]|uniref:Uncharacterized protein n=1 Tax=Promicromonospora citrea TaxID=43677 RepID=A0A8H9GGZ0_9MICO|nr:hypothetical protein GCM10010102_20310 [Promicromonospora citrea]
MVSPASRPVPGSIPVVPETKICEPARTPWLNIGELGAFGVLIVCRGMAHLLRDRPTDASLGEGHSPSAAGSGTCRAQRCRTTGSPCHGSATMSGNGGCTDDALLEVEGVGGGRAGRA